MPFSFLRRRAGGGNLSGCAGVWRFREREREREKKLVSADRKKGCEKLWATRYL